jgi:hypothetical protein
MRVAGGLDRINVFLKQVAGDCDSLPMDQEWFLQKPLSATLVMCYDARLLCPAPPEGI